MQIYADVTGRSIAVAGAPQASALGAAMLGAAAAGAAGGTGESLATIALRMAPPAARVYDPIAANQAQYNILYREYKRLYDQFGRGGNEVMKLLRSLRRRSGETPSSTT